MVNNALYWSGDANYVLKSSSQLRNSPDTQQDFYELVMANFAEARELSGTKAIVFYGADVLSKLDSLFPEQALSVRKLVEEGLGPDGRILRLPAAVTPASSNGWMIINLDQIKTHYTTFPSLKDQGINNEKMYSWHNFLIGSIMVEVLAYGGIIRQPVTFEAP